MLKYMMIKVKDMACEHCSTRISKVLAENGIDASVDLETKTVSTNGDVATVMNIIEEAGYTPQLLDE